VPTATCSIYSTYSLCDNVPKPVSVASHMSHQFSSQQFHPRQRAASMKWRRPYKHFTWWNHSETEPLSDS